MRNIRNSLFETNSSSIHAISVPYEPNTVEEILKQVDPEVDEYLLKGGLVFGKLNDKNSGKVYEFQQKLNILWDYLMYQKAPAFLRRWDQLLEILKEQPYEVGYELNIGSLSLDMRKQLIYFSGILDDKIKLFKFIFLEESGFCAFDHLYWNTYEDVERKRKDLYVLCG